MPTHNRDYLDRPQLKRITSLAQTLTETAEELYNLSRTRQPELHSAAWLIKQTHTRIHEILTILGEDL